MHEIPTCRSASALIRAHPRSLPLLLCALCGFAVRLHSLLLDPPARWPYGACMADLQSYLEEKRCMIDRELAKRMPAETVRPASLHEAMRYAALSDGKRLRPILCMAACEAVGAAAHDALVPALAVELVHTYTLVHDDMPCMDDDDTRRGRPTVHKVYGEANALLVGDALLALAFEWLAAVAPPTGHPGGVLFQELAHASGSRGVVGGQAEDMSATGHAVAADVVDYIHAHKTGSLIRAALRLGAIAGGGDSSSLEKLSTYGSAAGKAFQLADDILNATAVAEQLGKPAGTDATHGKATYVAVHGLDTARADAGQLVNDAVTALEGLPGNTETLVLLARYIVERTR